MAQRNQPAVEILMDLVNLSRVEARLPPATQKTFRVRNVRKYEEDPAWDTTAEVAVLDESDDNEDVATIWRPVYYNRISILRLLGEAPIAMPYKPEYATVAQLLTDLNALHGTSLSGGDIVDATIDRDTFAASQVPEDEGKFDSFLTVFCNPNGVVFRGCFVVRLVSETDPRERF